MTYPNYPGSRPGPHAATHGPGGTDPLNVDALGLATTTQLSAEETARIAGDSAVTAAAATDATTKADGAQAYAIQRANHTGTQEQSTVTNLVSDLASKATTTALAAETAAREVLAESVAVPLTASTVAAFQVAWENSGAPIKVSDSGGDDQAYNTWPIANVFYDRFRDQLVVGYNSGLVRDEKGSENAHKRDFRIRILKGASSVPLYEREPAFTAPIVVFDEIASGVQSVTEGLTMVQAGPNRGRYVAVISTILYADEPNPETHNTPHRYVYSDDGGATWSDGTETLKDSAGNDIEGAYFYSATGLSDGSLIGCNHADNVWGSSARREIYKSWDGGNSWTKQLTIGTEELTYALADTTDVGSWYPVEPYFCELDGPDHILVLWRGNGSEADVRRMLISTLTEGQTVMSALRKTSLVSAANPGSVFYDRATQSVHAVFGSRGSLAECGCYYASASFADALRGVFNSRMRVNAASKVDDVARLKYTATPSACLVGSKVYAFYMDQTSGSSEDIYLVVGSLPERTRGLNELARVADNPVVDTLDLSQISEGLVVAYDFANQTPLGADDVGRVIVDVRKQKPGLIQSTDATHAPAFSSTSAVFTQDIQSRFFTVDSDFGTNKFGAICVHTPESFSLTGTDFRNVLALWDNQNLTGVFWLWYRNNTGLKVRAAGAGGVGATVTQVLVDAPTLGVQHVFAAWFDLDALTLELWVDGVSQGSVALNSGTPFDMTKFRLVLGGNPYPAGTGSDWSSAPMSVRFAGVWRDAAGFAAARTYLQTAY